MNGTLTRYDLESWGGFLQQSGYPTGALLGERLLFGRIVYAYRLAQQRIFDEAYAGVSLEAGPMQYPLVPGSPTGLLKSAAVFLGIDTPVGPLYPRIWVYKRWKSQRVLVLGTSMNGANDLVLALLPATAAPLYRCISLRLLPQENGR